LAASAASSTASVANREFNWAACAANVAAWEPPLLHAAAA
jgi:hypothetical protein